MDSGMKARMAPPLGLLTVAALLRGAHRVSIEDENLEGVRYDDSPDVVGITVTVDVLPRAAAIAARFRERGVPVVAGGIHVTTAWEQIPEGCFDALCVGMAEGTWPALMEDLAQGRLRSLYRCPETLTGRDIVSPAYDLADPGRYLYSNVVHTSRGCPFRCDFCYNSSDTRRYFNRPVEDVVREVESIGLRHVMFVDDNFIGDPDWTRELLGALRPMGIKWNAAVSANILDLPDLLDEMRDSGCQSLFIGFESINRASLAGVHKGQNAAERYSQLVAAVHARGIMINASFVFGLDGDTPAVFQDTLDWIVAHRIETVTSHILTPYPGTALYRRMRGQGRILTEDLSQYNTAHVVFSPAQMTEEELYSGYLWIYRRIYNLKNILRRVPRAKGQVLPYLAFNLFYRKLGGVTDLLCRLVGYGRIGRWGQRMAKY